MIILALPLTWESVPRPPGVKPIRNKWMYSVKLTLNGNLNRFKSRLVALGNKQEYGVKYDETFTRVTTKLVFKPFLSTAAS